MTAAPKLAGLYPFTPGHTKSDTSRAAAESIAPLTKVLVRKIMVALVARPMTCAEIETALELSHQTASARLSEMKKFGLVEDTGERRPTPSGRSAMVYRLSQGAAAMASQIQHLAPEKKDGAA
jgi:DNA-binding transcriptional ArsR family regulator